MVAPIGFPPPKPDASKQLQVVPERQPLTELEARRIGVAALRLSRLRYLWKTVEDKPQTGRVWVGSGPMARGQELGSADLQAAIAFLIERDELFLASMNVKIERPE